VHQMQCVCIQIYVYISGFVRVCVYVYVHTYKYGKTPCVHVECVIQIQACMFTGVFYMCV